jgi:uncharacterized RDD family membrane protein YckC
MQVNIDNVVYAGFWARLFASMLDSIVQLLIFFPLMLLVFGSQFFMNPEFAPGFLGFFLYYVLPVIWVILFWKYKSATPGKMMMGMSIVDASTGGDPAISKLVLRYFSYFVSLIPCFLGFFWVAWDKRKQAFHDKIAGTVVIMNPPVTKTVKAGDSSAERGQDIDP